MIENNNEENYSMSTFNAKEHAKELTEKLIIKKDAGVLRARAEVDELADRLGLEIDPGIKETVVALRASGLNTTQSCEGHSGPGLPWPWVDVVAPGEPEERWEGELAEFLRVAVEKGLNFDNLRRGDPLDIYQQIINQVSNNPQTAQFEEWRASNGELGKRLEQLLSEFYVGRMVDEAVRIRIDQGELTGSRLQSFEQKAGDFVFEYTSVDSEKHQGEIPLLEKRRAEMNAFAEFLLTRS
ncbi:MAG: hypothetical protein WCP14_00180 [bacterium]